MKKTTILDIQKMKQAGVKIPVLTAYGYSIARLIDKAGVPVILVGDSVGMVEAGYDSTIPVTMDEMIYHTRAVSRASAKALVVADMPFMSYQADVSDAVRNAGRLIKEGGAEAVKLEGGVSAAASIGAITDVGIPVMGHVGLTPQSVHKLGGYKVQGKGSDGDAVLEDALAVEEAGAFSVVLEAVPAVLAKRITRELKIPTIGIGAGVHCDGQVLVINDMLGLDTENKPLIFVKQYANIGEDIEGAAREFIADVQGVKFPKKEHSY
jgi:3-methyl-2-oxobutanoate hydroxymethyltransferase